MADKLTTLSRVAALVNPGDTLALGGMTLYRRPVAFVRALLARHQAGLGPSDLTLLAFTAGLESDLLVGSGMVSRVRTCYFGLEIFGLAPMFTYRANHGQITILEESEASLSFGLRATLAGINFMPGRGWLGTDLPKLRPDVRKIVDPYSGEELMAFPAIHTDIAVLHALRADPDGNTEIGNNKGIDEELALTSKTVIVTAEEIVPELTKADIAAPWIDFVVHAPKGALPTSCHPIYSLDGLALLAYTDQVSDLDSWKTYVTHFLAQPSS
jgi:glutaconate CoA-transferase subunit A